MLKNFLFAVSLFKLQRLAVAAFLVCVSFALTVTPVQANGGMIRDTEIENLLRRYVNPIFRAAGLVPSSIKVYLINADSLNAFVAGGQRIFVHTGLLTRTKTPNELIGVLAHETGHIAGGHLATMGLAMERASVQNIIAMLLGAAAVAGGAMAGNSQIAASGQGIMAGGTEIARRNFLSYVRVQESAADQAAAKYLSKTKQSTKGMLDLFRRMANQSLVSSRYIDPYTRSHPMELERIRNLEVIAKKSPYYDKPESPDLLFRHKMMQAKLIGFLHPSQVFRKYPTSNTSQPARYARAITSFRSGDIRNAIRELKILVKAQPKNPYYWELTGQALLNAGQPAPAVKALNRAVKYAPKAGLIRILLSQALLAQGTPKSAKAALKHLRIAQRTEHQSPELHRQRALAYARLGDIPKADLATAEASLLFGDFQLAKQKAAEAKKKFKRGTPQWQRADDILKFKPPKN